MRLFVTGASGVLGRTAIRLLTHEGHRKHSQRPWDSRAVSTTSAETVSTCRMRA